MVRNVKLNTDVILVGIQLLFFVLLIIFVFPHSKDDRIIGQIRKDGVRFETGRVIVWVEKDYLDKKAIEEFGELADKGIRDIENYLKITFDKEHFSGEKPAYFLKSGKFISRCCECNPLFRKPYIILCGSYLKTAPYLYLTVRLVAWNSNERWLQDGLALYLNDKLGGWPTWPNFGVDLDLKAKNYFEDGNPLKYFALEMYKKIGENTAPQFEIGEYEIFSVLSASFVKYLDDNLGTDQFMSIYESKNPKQTIYQLTRKGMDKWKDEWLSYICKEK
ncbi:MAG: hypothetical protein ABII64_05910 [Elusimicrobiota bacterium]